MLQEHAGLRVLFFLSSVNKSLSMNAAKRPFSDVAITTRYTATQRQQSGQCSRAPIRSRGATVTAFRHIAGNGPLQAREPAESGRAERVSVFLIRRSAIAFDASCLLVKAIHHGTHEESSLETL